MDCIEAAEVDRITTCLAKLFWFADRITQLFRSGIKRETEKTSTHLPIPSSFSFTKSFFWAADGTTLFRLNTLTTKAMTYFSKLIAADYLIETLQPTVLKLKEIGYLEVRGLPSEVPFSDWPAG